MTARRGILSPMDHSPAAEFAHLAVARELLDLHHEMDRSWRPPVLAESTLLWRSSRRSTWTHPPRIAPDGRGTAGRRWPSPRDR